MQGMLRTEVEAACKAFIFAHYRLFEIPKTARITIKVGQMRAKGLYYNDRDDLGEFHVITINHKMHLTRQEVEGTLAHELIHCEQRIRRTGVNHSQQFWGRVAEVAKALEVHPLTIADKELDK